MASDWLSGEAENAATFIQQLKLHNGIQFSDFQSVPVKKNGSPGIKELLAWAGHESHIVEHLTQ